MDEDIMRIRFTLEEIILLKTCLLDAIWNAKKQRRQVPELDILLDRLGPAGHGMPEKYIEIEVEE